MSDTQEELRRKMEGVEELGSVVRTMKTLAASNIGQFERASKALEDYYRTVELGLVAWFRQENRWWSAPEGEGVDQGPVVAVVFGSDQGLVGQFNEVLAEFTLAGLGKIQGAKEVWAVGERIRPALENAGFPLAGLLAVPNSVEMITPLIAEILMNFEEARAQKGASSLYIFNNRPKLGAVYAPAAQRLLPLDDRWRRDLEKLSWPTANLPEVALGDEGTILALVSEFLFVSLFRACSDSLASENASRLAAMQRAEKNIQELLEGSRLEFNRLRQASIDEELFEVIAGFEALTEDEKRLTAINSRRRSAPR